MIAAIGTTKNARRASFIHLYFNVIGTIICTIVFYTLNAFMKFDFMDKTIDTFQIAIVHTLFSVIYTLMLLPFGKQLERLAVLSIPDSKDDPQPVMLDERLLATPAIAVEQTRVLRLQLRCSGTTAKKAIMRLQSLKKRPIITKMKSAHTL